MDLKINTSHTNVGVKEIDKLKKELKHHPMLQTPSLNTLRSGHKN